jgi:hypothetical protein
MLRWAAVSFASPFPLSHQRRAPTALPTTSRSLGTLRDRSLSWRGISCEKRRRKAAPKSGADANGFFRTDFHRYARYFSPIYSTLSALQHTDCGPYVIGLPSERRAAFLSVPVFLCRVGVQFYNRPVVSGARRVGSAVHQPDSPTAERRIQCGWGSIYVNSSYVLSPRLCFVDRNHVWRPWSSFEAVVKF